VDYTAVTTAMNDASGKGDRKKSMMATVHAPTDAKIARSFAALLRNHPAVQRLWSRRDGDAIEFWVLTEPISRASELSIYQLATTFRERFPGLHPRIHVVHADLYDTDTFVFHEPVGAEPVQLSR